MKMRKIKDRDDRQTSLIGTIFRIQTESGEGGEREREFCKRKIWPKNPLFPSLLEKEERDGGRWPRLWKQRGHAAPQMVTTSLTIPSVFFLIYTLIPQPLPHTHTHLCPLHPHSHHICLLHPTPHLSSLPCRSWTLGKMKALKTKRWKLTASAPSLTLCLWESGDHEGVPRSQL